MSRTPSSIARATVLIAACAGTLAVRSGAQVVRGKVTDRATADADAGVLITLERLPVPGHDTAEVVGRTLTDTQGEYAVRAPGPGRYHLNAKRIGVRRFTSEPFELGDAETRRVDIALDALLYRLPEVAVTGRALCVPKRDHAQRVASLWDEVRTALTATQLSVRDRLFQARVVRYVRELDPRTLTVQSDQRQEMRGTVERPFISLSGDSLSKVGYWRASSDGVSWYYAPDDDVLLSQAFARDHCFALVEDLRQRPGLTGLGFDPVMGRHLPDVRGTIWLDAKTFELRLVEFRYTQLDPAPNADKLGGEVHFARLPSGAWIVQHWFIRIPRYTAYVARASAIDVHRSIAMRSPTITEIIEEGGDVVAEGVPAPPRAATVTGEVLDSTGSALVGAAVRVEGTSFRASVDAKGQFKLEGLPPGRYRLVVEHPWYAALGTPVARAEELTLAEGGSTHVSYVAPSTEAIVVRLCDGNKPVPRRATLRVTLLDSASSTPLGGLPLRLTWPELSGGHGSVQMRSIVAEGVTDQSGSVTFCALPADLALTLGLGMDRDPAHSVAAFKLLENEIAAQVVRISRPQ